MARRNQLQRMRRQTDRMIQLIKERRRRTSKELADVHRRRLIIVRRMAEMRYTGDVEYRPKLDELEGVLKAQAERLKNAQEKWEKVN